MSDTPKIQTRLAKTANLLPHGENLLLSEPESTSVTGGGIIIPEAHRTKVNQGKVLELGPLADDKIHVNDVVFFPLHSESRIEFGGQKFIIVPSSSVLGIIRR